jgi:hypothetical protein
MEPSPWVNGWSVSREFPNIVQNPKIQCRAYKSLPLVFIPSQMNPVHTLHPISITSI